MLGVIRVERRRERNDLIHRWKEYYRSWIVVSALITWALLAEDLIQ